MSSLKLVRGAGEERFAQRERHRVRKARRGGGGSRRDHAADVQRRTVGLRERSRERYRRGDRDHDQRQRERGIAEPVHEQRRAAVVVGALEMAQQHHPEADTVGEDDAEDDWDAADAAPENRGTPERLHAAFAPSAALDGGLVLVCALECGAHCCKRSARAHGPEVEDHR